MAVKKENNGVDKNRPAGQRSDEDSIAESLGNASEEQGLMGQVQESGREIASKSLEAIGSRTQAAASGYRADISSGLHTLADGLRQTSSTIQASDDKPLSTAGGRYIEDLADKVERVSDYFERKDPADLLQDVKRFARENPTIFVGGAFVAGFALSRLMRSASTSAPQDRGRA